MGETLVKSLFESGTVRSVSDIYKLDEQTLAPFFLNEESLSQEKKSLGAHKVALSIQNHRTVTLQKFIAGFDIEGIGETVVEKLIDAGFDTFEKITAATAEQIAGVYGFAEILAATFVEGMKENEDEMRSLLEGGTIEILSTKSGPLAGKSFCFTGELYALKRADAQNMVKAAGGSVKSSVVKGLDYLVTNDTSSGSSKNLKAAKLGIPVIDEKEFLAMVGK